MVSEIATMKYSTMPLTKTKYSPLLKYCSKPINTMPKARTLSVVLANIVILQKIALLLDILRQKETTC